VTRTAVLAAALLALAAPARADLDDAFGLPPTISLGRALARSVAKTIPMPAASSGITFTFDPKTSAFVRSTEVLGQVFLERARPIGRGHLNVSVTYQYVDVDTYEGQDLDSLSDPRPIRDPTHPVSFVIPRFDASLVTHVATPSLTYGVTDELEVNLTVPVLHTESDVEARLRVIGGDVQRGAEAGDATGFGDVLLRVKYRLVHGRFGDLAAGLVFRLPSGRIGNFQGTGLFEIGPRIYATTPAVSLASQVRVQGFLDAGLDLTPENARRGEGRYGLGMDVMFASRATVSLAFLAREPFSRLLPPGSIEVLRTDGSRRPLFGIDPGHPSYYDLSIGGRVNLWRDTVFLMGNVIVPLNDDGVRASVIPLIGIEAAF
jgi:hypothetical protein